MPEKILRIRKTNLYKVVNAKTGRVHAKSTTKAKAQAQVRIINAADRKRK